MNNTGNMFGSLNSEEIKDLSEQFSDMAMAIGDAADKDVGVLYCAMSYMIHCALRGLYDAISDTPIDTGFVATLSYKYAMAGESKVPSGMTAVEYSLLQMIALSIALNAHIAAFFSAVNTIPKKTPKKED